MTETAAHDDAELARRAASGDRAAFGALYERFGSQVFGFAARTLANREDAADVTQDVFVRAAERIGQLREPERVRAWLFAIARHECYARSRRRAKTRPVDPMDAANDVASSQRSIAGETEARELSRLVWDACKGLTDEDRAVVELRLRHDFDFADIADALAISKDSVHKVVARATERFERSVVALVLARGARKDCPELARIVGPDTDLTPTLRKSIARHVEQCEVCETHRRKLVAPSQMVASAAELTPPAGLGGRVVDAMVAGSSGVSMTAMRWGRDGFPRARRRPSKIVAAGAAAALLLLGGVVAGSRLGEGPSVRDTVVVTATDVPATLPPVTTVPPPVSVTTVPPPVPPPVSEPVTTAPVVVPVATTTTTTTITTTTTSPRSSSTVPSTSIPVVPPTTAAPTTAAPTTRAAVTTTTRPRRRTTTTVRRAAPTTSTSTSVAAVASTLPPATVAPITAPPTTVPLTVPVFEVTTTPAVTTVPATTVATPTTVAVPPTTRCVQSVVAVCPPGPTNTTPPTTPTTTTTTVTPNTVRITIVRPPIILFPTTTVPIVIR